MQWKNTDAPTISCCTLLCFEIADYLEGEIILKLQQDETFQHFFHFVNYVWIVSFVRLIVRTSLY